MKQQKRDLWFMFGLVLVALAMRVPFMSHYLFHWDSVNFALSLERYDVRLHQPHPPGYILYSALGSLVNSWLKDANTSLVMISLIGGVAGLIAIYWLGRTMFDRRVGVVAALIALTSPTQWFHSEVALTYALEFALVTVVAGLCYKQLAGDRSLWLPLAVILGIAGGVRQNDLAFMLPLWLLSLYPLSWKQRIGSVLALLVCVVLWAYPMVSMSGGWAGYRAALDSASDAVVTESSVFAAGQLALNAARMGIYLAYGVGLGGLILALSLLLFIRSGGFLPPRAWIHDRRAWVLTLWIVTPILFYVFIHIRQPGHIFTFLPAVILVLALAICALGDAMLRQLPNKVSANAVPTTAIATLTAVVVLSNAAFFLAAPASIFGSGRLPLQTTSRRTLAWRDQALDERLSYLRNHFDPASTVVFADGLDFRHVDYYLRDFQASALSYQLKDETVGLPAQVKTLVLFNELTLPDLAADVPVQQVELPDGAEGIRVALRYYTWDTEAEARLSRSRLETRPQAKVEKSKVDRVS